MDVDAVDEDDFKVRGNEDLGAELGNEDVGTAA